MKKVFLKNLNPFGKFFMLAIMALACQVEENVKVAPVPENIETRLNPFSTEIIAQALQNIMARSSGRINVEPPSTTHNYVRFEPQNLDQILQLQDMGYELWDEPLDQEIDYSGDYYHQPGLPDSLNYFYTLIPSNYLIPPFIPSTTISQIVLFDENAGDESDVEIIEDPWIPEPEPCIPFCPDPYVYCPPCMARENAESKPSKPEDLLRKTTKSLLNAGVDLLELYNEIMKLAGYPDDVIESSSSGRTMSYRPSGCLFVNDNSVSASAQIPVKTVMVKSKRWFKLDRTYTNANGCFTANKEFRQKAKIIVKFKNGLAKVRGINGALKLWQYTFPLKKKLGLYDRASMQNFSYTFPYSSNANSMTALQFAAAHCMSTLQDQRQYSQTHGLLGYAPGSEYSLNIWISSVHTQSASAPMLRSIFNSSQLVSALQYLFPGTVSNVINILKRYSPDITMRLQDPNTGSTRFSANINGTFFHEFGHTMHYNQVGNNYWATLIAAIVSNGGYGIKSSFESGRVAVAESWGFFIGPTFNRLKYSTQSAIATENLNFLERQRNNNTDPIIGYNASLGYSQGWIPWGMHHDLIDVGEPSITLITDQVSGYTINGIFKGFHQGSTSVQSLKAAILANNNNSQATQVNTLVTGYGW